MYTPDNFKQTDKALLDSFIRAHSFATLFCGGVATHLPLQLENGYLLGHMARANPHWKSFNTLPVLCVFQGPHAYISPSMYIDQRHNVPTWNYTAVHITGKAEIIEDDSTLESILQKTVSFYEGGREKPWAYNVPEEYRLRLIKGIVGFKISCDKVEGKFKLSQNRKAEDYNSVLKVLKTLKDDNSVELLKYMKLTNPF